MTRGKPTIRILRHLARTGGTLITKCLGSMDGVVVLSEIHPANLAVTNPMMQACEWFGLIDKAQIARWRQMGGPSMLQFVGMCETRAAGRGEALVLRDWSHLDYYGLPYTKATMGAGLRESLGDAYEILEACTTRHPVDQYVSLSGVEVIGEIDWDLFLDGNLAFARYAVETGFVRYEDLTSDPDEQLKKLCSMLKMGFDPQYAQRWSSYEKITGDVARGGSRGTREAVIRPLVRKEVDPDLLARFRDDERYVETCTLLGYEV